MNDSLACSRHNDDRNKAIYTVGHLANFYGTIGQFIDGGEQHAFETVADELRNRAILDLGVGAGRTTSLVRLLTEDYVGLDYSPTQVAQCSAVFPSLDISEGDARDLSRFPDGRFGGVMFSWNGIDMVDHADRLVVLKGIHRVLAENGLLLLGTLNKDGRLYMRPPWRRQSPTPITPPVRRVVGAILAGLLDWRRHLRVWSSWWAERSFAEDHGEWAIAPRGSGHGLIAHWTTTSGLRTDLGSTGFELIALFESDGETLPLDATSARSRWLHAVARRV